MGVTVVYGGWISFTTAAVGALHGGYHALPEGGFVSGIQRMATGIADRTTTSVFLMLENLYPEFDL